MELAASQQYNQHAFADFDDIDRSVIPRSTPRLAFAPKPRVYPTGVVGGFLLPSLACSTRRARVVPWPASLDCPDGFIEESLFDEDFAQAQEDLLGARLVFLCACMRFAHRGCRIIRK